MQLQITHSTRYDYAAPVGLAQHMAYLCPRETPCQHLLSHQLEITPAPAQHYQVPDVYGNTRQYFDVHTAHKRLSVDAHSLVQTWALAPPPSTISWEQARARFDYRATSSFDAACEFSFVSAHVPRDPAFASYAAPSFQPGRALLELGVELMQRIHQDCRYQSYSTDISTPAAQALAARRGVCQDFAHILLGCLRAYGLAARYVSGYLLTQPLPGQPRLRGSDASHAWVALYLPDLPAENAWCDLDPTNNRWGWGAPGPDYVTLAYGRDYADVSPLRGVIQGGGGGHTLHVGVGVESHPNTPV